MMLRVDLLRCTPGTDRNSFHGVLLRDVPALAAAIPGIRHFSINAVIDDSHRLTIPPGCSKFDALAYFWFDDAAALRRADESRTLAAASAPVESMLNGKVALDVVQREFVGVCEGAARQRLLKRMSLLYRAPELDGRAFQHEWEFIHGPRVAAHGESRGPDRAPLRGYFQDAVVASRTEIGPREQHCDGVTELWFDDADAMDRVLPPDSPSSVTANASRIIGSISTFLVREVRVF